MAAVTVGLTAAFAEIESAQDQWRDAAAADAARYEQGRASWVDDQGMRFIGGRCDEGKRRMLGGQLRCCARVTHM